MVGINRNFAGINNNTKLTTLNKATSKNVVNANLQLSGNARLSGTTTNTKITTIKNDENKEGTCNAMWDGFDHYGVDSKWGDVFCIERKDGGCDYYVQDKDGSLRLTTDINEIKFGYEKDRGDYRL